MSSEYRPRFGDPIRISQITNPTEQREHLHRLIQQLAKDEWLALSDDLKEICDQHTATCNDCNIKLIDFENSRMFD